MVYHLVFDDKSGSQIHVFSEIQRATPRTSPSLPVQTL